MVRSPARGVPLLMRHHETRAHSVVIRLGCVLPPTFTHAYTAQCGMGKATFVVWIFEMRFWLPWVVVRSKSQVFINAIRINDFSRIHLPIGVPDGFELTECLDQFCSEHLAEKFSTRLPVTVLSAQATAILDAQIRGLIHEGTPFPDAWFAHQVKAYAAMDATLPKMSVKCRVVVVFVVEGAQVAKITAQLFRRDGRIFPSFPGIRLAGNKCGGTKSGFTHLPDVLRICQVSEQSHRWSTTFSLQHLHDMPGEVNCILSLVCAELRHEPSLAFWQ